MIKKIDRHCKTPLCIRHLRKLVSGYWQFELHWNTSTGTVKTKGWLWSPERNRIDGPRCRAYPMMDLHPHTKAAIRSLFTAIMQQDHQIVVPAVQKRSLTKSQKKEVKNAKDKDRKQVRNVTQDHERPQEERGISLAEAHPEWGDLLG